MKPWIYLSIGSLEQQVYSTHWQGCWRMQTLTQHSFTSAGASAKASRVDRIPPLPHLFMKSAAQFFTLKAPRTICFIRAASQTACTVALEAVLPLNNWRQLQGVELKLNFSCHSPWKVGFIHYKAHFYCMTLTDRMSEWHKIIDCALTMKHTTYRCSVLERVCLLKSGKKIMCFTKNWN